MMSNLTERNGSPGLSPVEDLEDGEILDMGEAVKNLTVEAFNDGYDDQLMGDAEDRARLQAMNELEREKELYQRSIRREELQRKWYIRCQLAKEREVAVAIEADPGVKERSHIRRQLLATQRAGNTKANALERSNKTKEKLFETVDDQPEEPVPSKKIRKVKLKGNEAHSDQHEPIDEQPENPEPLKKNHKVKLKAIDVYSDDSSSSNSDVSSRSPEQSPRGSSNASDEPVVTTREQLSQAILTRSQLESLLDKPIFEKTVTGCFVRINIGFVGLANVNRIYQIVGLHQDRKVYRLGGKSTNLILHLRYGVQECPSSMDVVSNQPVTQDEFYMWSGTWQCDLKFLPLLSEIAKKQEDIVNAMQYEFTEEDVVKLIQSKRQTAPKRVTLAYKKVCLFMERDQALGQNDMEKVQSIDKEIQELDGPSGGQLDSVKVPSQSLPQPQLARMNTHVPLIYSATPCTKKCRTDRPPNPDDFQLERHMRRKYKKSSVVSRSRVEIEAEDWGGDADEEDEDDPMVADPQLAAAATATPEEFPEEDEQKVNLRDLHNFKVNINISSLVPFTTIFKDFKFGSSN